MESLIINQRQIYLLRVTPDICKSGIEFSTSESASIKYPVVARVGEEAIKHYGTDIFFVLYSLVVKYSNVFEDGIEYRFKMLGYKPYTSDWVQAIVDIFFEQKLPEVFSGKLNEEYTRIYLASYRENLEAKLITPTPEQIALYENPEQFLISLYQKFAMFGVEEISKIVKVISSNKLTSATSPNLFNLSQTEPMQQSALNIKKITSNQADLEVDTSVVSYEEGANLSAGFFYIPDCPVITIEATIHCTYFYQLIMLNYVQKFYIIENHMNMLKLRIGIRQDVYDEYFKKRKCMDRTSPFYKRPLQYQIVEASPETVTCFRSFTNGSWQCGDDYIFKLDKFSNETMKCTSKRIELYGIFSLDALRRLVALTKCPFFIKRIINYKKFTFYYAQCFVFQLYKHTLFDFITTEGQKRQHFDDSYSFNEKIWSGRTNFHFIYHTYFNFANDALMSPTMRDPESRAKIVQAVKINLINFKYIKATGNVQPIPFTKQDAITFAYCTLMGL